MPGANSLWFENRLYLLSVLMSGQSEESGKVLTKHKTGWFGETAIHDIITVANDATGPGSKLTFEQCFKCDPSHPTYGYKSWDGEFCLTCKYY